MENRFRKHLIAWVVVACLLLAAVPASALTPGHLEELVSKYAVKTQPLSSAEAKNTTRLSPPKKLAIKVGQIKRINLNLKYKIQPDTISVTAEGNNCVEFFTHNNDLFALGLDMGLVSVFMQSGVKKATTKITVTPMPITGIALTGDLLQVNQFFVSNLSDSVVPAIASGTVKWASDRPKVVKVTKNGGITCKKPGNAVITCRTKNGNKLVGSILVIVS